MKKNTKEIQFRKIVIMVAILVVFFVIFTYLVLLYNNERNARKTGKVMLNQVSSILEKNQYAEETLLESLKEEYTIRAKTVAYILGHHPEAEYDVKELCKIAELMSIDEIHIFDETGTIYSGTLPEYYGYNFDSGDQISYFKPMLEDKSLSMCQDVLPNSVEGKMMMYAITWDDTGKRMLQVGIEPTRLLAELKNNQISNVVDSMPVYQNLEIYVVDASTGELLGATDDWEEIDLNEMGIDISQMKENVPSYYCTVVNGKKSECSVVKDNGYVICIVQYQEGIRKDTIPSMLMVVVYLVFAAIALLILVKQLLHLMRESNTDELTQCYNRRAYENDLQTSSDISIGEDFVFVSMDVNGLKNVNDTLGHVAGDELLTGAAECIKRCFGHYGKVYRMGGDEFVAMIFANADKLKELKEDLEESIHNWSGEIVDCLSVSCGYVTKKEFPNSTIQEIAKIADNRMYEAKTKHYNENGGHRRENS